MDKPLIHTTDPLAIASRFQSDIKDQLVGAVNYVGERVIVGHGTTLWGGKSPNCIGIELHDDVRLFDGCRLVADHALPESGIILRKRVALNFNVYMDGSGGVDIGEGTIIGPNVVIVSSGHVVSDDTPVQESGKHYGKVTVGKNVWIGANAVIMKGVMIGDGAVIGAGSVVTKPIHDGEKVAGNPARPIGAKYSWLSLNKTPMEDAFLPLLP